MKNRRTKLLLSVAFCACLAESAFCADAPAGREYTGDFVLNGEIPVNLAAGTAAHPKLVEVRWVRIEPIYGNAWVLTARVGWSPVVDSTWQIRIELLDDKGSVLKHSRDRATTFTGKADGSDQSAMHYADLSLDAMQWEMRRHAAKIRVVLEPAEDASAALSAGESPYYELAIVAVDARDKKPLADAVVIATGIHRGEQYRSHTSLYRTDSQGQCRVAFEKADLSVARVIVQKAGYVNLHKAWSAPYSWPVSDVPLADLPDRHVVEMTPAQTIGGIVQDQAGRPVAQAQVRVEARLDGVSGMAGISRSIETDEEGHWQVEGIPVETDSLSLGFKHPEYVGDAWANRRIRADEIPPLCDRKHVVTLTKGLAMSGRVLDDQGRPVPRVAVILAPAYSGGFRYEYAYTLTDASGQFRFGCADNDLTDTTDDGGSSGVLVEMPGYVPTLQRVIVEPNLAPLEFRLSPGRTVTVRVVDAKERPIAGASTVIHPLAEDPRYGLWLADTDEQGRVQAPNAPDRDVLFTALQTGFVSVRDYTLPASRQEHVIPMQLAPKIQGIVRDARTGESIQEFMVGLTATIAGRARPSEPLRFKGGKFELMFDEAQPESLQLKVAAVGYKPTTLDSIRLEGRRAMEIKLDADPSFDARALQRELGGSQRSEPLVITGIVVDPNGHPVPDAAVSTIAFGGSEAATDAEGKFRLRLPSRMGGSMQEVPYILARARERNLAVAMELDTTATEDLTIKLMPGVILSGKVADTEGREVPGVKVSLTFWPGQMGYGLREEPAVLDPNGRYEIRAVPPDHRFSVNVTAEGYGREYAQVRTVEAVNNRMEIEPMVLKPANLDISGTVVDTENKPVPGANVGCYGRGQPSQRQVKTDAQGRFLIRGVCAGAAQIQANVQAGQSRLYGRVETEGGATDVKIVINPMGSVGRYVPARPPSLVGKPLPPLADLGLESVGDATKDRMILLCFFDMNQRPSRNCLLQVAKRTEELRQRGVAVLAVQAVEADRSALDRWLKEQNIAVPVGSIETDAKKAAFAWGVQSLPWLILTDSQHKVVAEGVAVGELDSTLEKVQP